MGMNFLTRPPTLPIKSVDSHKLPVGGRTNTDKDKDLTQKQVQKQEPPGFRPSWSRNPEHAPPSEWRKTQKALVMHRLPSDRYSDLGSIMGSIMASNPAIQSGAKVLLLDI